MSDRRYEIHEVAELTGMQAARLRAWERRYAVVRPERQPNGYRAYTGAQVELLRAFGRLVADGERIGTLAAQPAEEVIARAAGRGRSPHAAMLAAARALDRERLETLVSREVAERGLAGFARELALPLAHDLGELWALDRLPVAVEHLASEVVLHALKGGLRPRGRKGPLAVSACLPGERHEWGVLSALAAAQAVGWRCQHLGADLPVGDLLDAAWALRPAAVAVSGSNPELVHGCLGDLAALAVRLPPGVIAVAGGAGAEAQARLLRGFGWRIGQGAFTELPEHMPN